MAPSGTVTGFAGDVIPSFQATTLYLPAGTLSIR
jgi:hypothetical protein